MQHHETVAHTCLPSISASSAAATGACRAPLSRFFTLQVTLLMPYWSLLIRLTPGAASLGKCFTLLPIAQLPDVPTKQPQKHHNGAPACRPSVLPALLPLARAFLASCYNKFKNIKSKRRPHTSQKASLRTCRDKVTHG
jgi:hypothetical protein